MTHALIGLARRVACMPMMLLFFSVLFFFGCLPGANSMAESPSAGKPEELDAQEFRISAPLSGGQIVMRLEGPEEENSLCVFWIDEKGSRSCLWRTSQCVLDPEQAKPWFLLGHEGVEYFALSVFSGGARCCWEILVFRLDDPQLVKRGFASGASPQYLTNDKGCLLAAKIFPVSPEGIILWEPKIECLVDDASAQK